MTKLLLSGILFCVAPLSAITVSLTSSLPSPQPVGTVFDLTATGTDPKAGTLDYQYSVARNGQPAIIVQDYDISNTFEWVPATREGSFVVTATVRNLTTLKTATASISFSITSRIVGNAPAVTPAANPLVALFSAPACASGSSFRVKYTRGSGAVVERTSSRPCVPGVSNNIYVAGLLPSSTYSMNAEVVTGSIVIAGPTLQFTTGAIDPSIPFPPLSVLTPPTSSASSTQNVLLADPLPTPTEFYVPTAWDFQGRVIWYYPEVSNAAQQGRFFIRPIDGGTILLIVNDPLLVNRQQIIREIDLAGNIVRQTDVTRVNQQLALLGAYPIVAFDHDAVRLPNGHTLVIGSQEKIYPAGTQPSPQAGPVDILGDSIIDLDTNMQVAWYWSAYDHLDVGRAAILGETCTNGQQGCPPVLQSALANDWTHGNSLNYVPSDGSVLYSFRHQDWVVKIDYANGTGTGLVLWKLGSGGDFSIISSDPSPWFSHQHDAEYELGGTTLLSLFDNGNTRVTNNPGLTEHSRGFGLTFNYTNMTVTPTFQQDLGYFSVAVGSAQLLNNGNYHFDAGFINPGPAAYAQSTEWTTAGVAAFGLQDNTATYRTYRMDTLYTLGH